MYRQLGTLLLCCLASGSLYAQDSVCTKKPGVTICHRGKVSQDITANGMMKLFHTHVNGKVTVNGSLKADSSHIQSLKTNGGSSLTDSTITGSADVNGGLTAQRSQFKSQLKLSSNHAEFINSDLQSLQVQHTPPMKHKIYLTKGSHVHGDIHFLNGHGVVYLSRDSQIDGEVKGGEVKNYK